MTDIVLNNIASGYNLQKINDNFVTIQASINGDVVNLAGGNNVMLQDFDMNGNRILNAPLPESPTDVVRLQDLEDLVVFEGNLIIAKDEVTLTDGQTTVTFNLDIDAEFSVIDVHGEDIDSRRILLGDSYTIGASVNIIELTDSYPAGTKVVVSQGAITGGTEVSSIFGRSGAVTAEQGDYSADEVSFDDTNVSFTATEVQEAIEEVFVIASAPEPGIDELESFPPIAVPTALLVGKRYFSTVTNAHTLADGTSVGDMVVLTWAAGTIATVVAVSNITFTDKDNITTSDTTWVFDFPIVEIILVWNGTEWEIK